MSKKENFYKRKLDNGLTVLFEKRDLPVVATSVSVKFGSEYEPAEIKGVAHFIEHLVFKGTKNRTNQQISEDIEKKGGVINAFTSEEITCFWNKLPSRHIDTGIDVVSDLALNPLFKEEDINMERGVVLEEIKMYKDRPEFYVLEKIKELLYEKPFGMFNAGTFETMKMGRKEIVDTFNKNYSSNNMILAVVGRADFEEICKKAEKIFPKKISSIPNMKIVKKNGELIEKRKGIDQANIVLGYHAPLAGDRDRYASEILDFILAGGMSSRLFHEIREKKGYAYAIKGMLDQEQNYGYGLIYAGIVKDKVKEVKEIILREFRKLQKLESRDFEEAKESLIGLRAVGRESSEQTMLGLVGEEKTGDAEEFYNYEERINSLKLEQVRSLAKLKDYSFAALVPE
jgi:predicted Zn-dependent peptidase